MGKEVEAIESNWAVEPDLSAAQQRLQENVVRKWWALADEIVWRYNDGYYTYENTTKLHIGYPAWWLQMIGFDDSFIKPHWVKRTDSPPALLLRATSNLLSF